MADDELHAYALPAAASRLIRRQRLFLVIVGATAVLAVGALVASLFVKSPAQRAAEASPPPPSVLTATVEHKALTQSLVMRGDVASPGSIRVSGVLGGGEGPAIVTRLAAKPGQSVGNGQVLAEVAGRPIFALAGGVPAYRDIAVGTTGADAAQLRADLMALGFLTSGGAAEKFTTTDARGLLRFVTAAGYTPELDDAGHAMLRLANTVFLPTLPATVAAVGATLGTDLSGAQQPLMTITSGSLTVTATVPQGSQSGLKIGQRVSLADDVRGVTATGTVASVGAYQSEQTNDSDAAVSGTSPQGASTPGYPLTVKPDHPLGGDWLGANVKVTIVTGTTGGAALVVPVTAVSMTAAGKASVTVLGRGGTRRNVPIDVVLVSAGFAAVSAADSAPLNAGDRVVLG